MSYKRVLPRDLFTEALLLKCIGQLWQKTENNDLIEITYDGGDFNIVRDDSGDSLQLDNVNGQIRLSPGGLPLQHTFSLRLHTGDPWPLWIHSPHDERFESFRVLDDEGNLTQKMKALIQG